MRSMEKWRKFFEGAEGDIWSVIEAAISVAASDCPHELRNRRDKIAHTLFTFSPSAVNSEKTKEEDHSENAKEEDRSEIVQDRKESIKHVNCTNFQERKAGERSLREKVESSKRRLQQSYQQAEKAKKQRAIQIIEPGDLPTQDGSPISRTRMKFSGGFM